MKSPASSFALLVHSCDRYEFLYKGFDYFFSRHWDFNIPCNYYFATEEKDAAVTGFQNIKSGKGEWSDRLSFLLEEKIKEEYVLFFQEDMWLNKNVKPIFFRQLFDLTLLHKWEQVKLHSSEIYKTVQTPDFIEGLNVAIVDNAHSGYLMSHQVTLWNRKFFNAQLYKKENPWRNEKRGTKRLRKLNPEIIQIDYFAENGNKEINRNRHSEGRSEYHSISVNGILNHTIQPYIQLLNAGTGEERKYGNQLQHHYVNNLTHDGKAKPRKDDIFQKAKKWFRQK